MISFEYIRSEGAHAIHGAVDALVGSRREIWIGSDGSGLIREHRGPVEFFTDNGRARWEAAGRPALVHALQTDLFAAGCLVSSTASQLTSPLTQLATITKMLATHPRPLHQVQRLLGEAVVEADVCRAIYEIAAGSADVSVVDEVPDPLGRVGRALVGCESTRRVELFFTADCSQLWGYRMTLAEAQPFAPEATVVSWSSLLDRAIVGHLPSGTPPIPMPPCDPPGASQRFRIGRGYSVSTGCVTNPFAQLAELRNQGVITDAEHAQARRHLTHRIPL